jgi:hypothetical protein
MNEPEAIAVQSATATPAVPIDRKAASPRPRVEMVTRPARKRNAKSARPAIWVAVSTVSSRCRTPAVDHATAARATNS